MIFQLLPEPILRFLQLIMKLIMLTWLPSVIFLRPKSDHYILILRGTIRTGIFLLFILVHLVTIFAEPTTAKKMNCRKVQWTPTMNIIAFGCPDFNSFA